MFVAHRSVPPEPPLAPPAGYRVVKTDRRVPGGDTESGYRLRILAERYCDRMNAIRMMPSYRWEVVDTRERWPRRRYWPVAFQNVLKPIKETRDA